MLDSWCSMHLILTCYVITVKIVFQEVSGKLLECCSSIAGSCLEATTWLRRNLTVKTDTTEKKDGMNGERKIRFV